LGTLTKELAKRAGSVCAVELDFENADLLEREFHDHGNVKIIRGDILKTDIDGILSGCAGGAFKTVANLPYNIATQVIMRLLEGATRFESVVVMVQKEVAERFTARPGTKEYGALTVCAAHYASASIEAYVPRNCFYPRPNVDSAVIKLTPHYESDLECDGDWLFRVVRAAFGQRRKTIENALSAGGRLGIGKEEAAQSLARSSLPRGVRGETLSLGEFKRLARELAKFREAGAEAGGTD
ncbi:MAG: 16S rRNA (adenine(1518)-N(6)/adenine(1519)-N(6))-dimethyltransferase RsmA, partial [Defluviitaleaceae bacterium]|nr:16S rRNA (adenine(1518)-N(6)/adenine(1519)-N(6))-dimethyltransferase RsmA [Defluviitaleaceae bacterium]